MKLKRYIISAAGFLTAVVGTQAAMFTSLDWQFTTSESTAQPEINTSTPALGATATAKIVTGDAGNGYDAGALLSNPAAYGDRTGVWGVAGGSYQLNLGAYVANAGSSLTYTVAITEFVGNSGTIGLFPGTYNFSLAGGTLTGHVAVGTGGTEGSWFKDTWTFTVAPAFTSPLSLTITPTDALNGSLYVDRIQWDVAGDLTLTAVPEPMMATGLTAAGLALFGLWRSRRKV